MTACARPGCSGALEDGYCNLCGLAPAVCAQSPNPSLASAAGGSTSMPRTSTGAGSVRSGRTPTTRSARSQRSGSARSGRSTSRALGSRPLMRPILAPLDPLSVLVPGEVPEGKRYCSGCDVALRRESGFCPKCGQEYSFVPSLKPGDLIANKYEIKGTLAFGGLGWIYLALDTILNRWVVLKGLLNSKDPRMLEVAVQEREYLAAVKHPNIVGIYDFITHQDQGFIVMEHVNGKTLMTLRKERGGPLPVTEAISYILEILPAFDCLSEMSLVYCDFKPENVMVEEGTVKLIDMGAVRHQDATGGDIYGSKGYTAPEAHDAPSALSDLYSVARALAVLVASFDFQGKYEESLPHPEECSVFQDNDTLYRFLLKATRKKPEDRFASAAEMADQLLGVLRGVLGPSAELGPAESALFDPDSDPSLETATVALFGSHGVPRLKVDKSDAAVSVILAAGAIADPERRLALFERALQSHSTSLELKLRKVDELITLGRYEQAEEQLAKVQKEAPRDWRFAWYRGRSLLAQGKAKETLAAFQSILDELPGELGPKQALGRAYEMAGDLERAIRYYDAVSKADNAFTSAAFGLARCLEKKGDKPSALEAYRRVPSTSSKYSQAQMALVRLVLSQQPAALPSLDDLTQASAALEALEGLTDSLETHLLRAELLSVAARYVASTGQKPLESVVVLQLPLHSKKLRQAAENEFRLCARYAVTPEDHIHFVDAANAIRPMTLVLWRAIRQCNCGAEDTSCRSMIR